jgi:hypothetical protein
VAGAYFINQRLPVIKKKKERQHFKLSQTLKADKRNEVLKVETVDECRHSARTVEERGLTGRNGKCFGSCVGSREK